MPNANTRQEGERDPNANPSEDQESVNLDTTQDTSADPNVSGAAAEYQDRPPVAGTAVQFPVGTQPGDVGTVADLDEADEGELNPEPSVELGTAYERDIDTEAERD